MTTPRTDPELVLLNGRFTTLDPDQPEASAVAVADGRLVAVGHDGDVRAWLYTILTNLNRNRLRSLSRRPTLTPIKDSDAAITGPDTGSRDIARALDDLAEDQRAALLLVVLEGLTYREVAEVQGVPIGTVMSRLARARMQIKAYLDGERPALRRVK